MIFEFWGVRGTAPASGRDIVKYGGRTLCTSVSLPDGGVVIIDAGTGIRRLGEKLMSRRGDKLVICHVFLTHFHLDHIMGIPFFQLLYSEKADLIFYAPAPQQETKRYLGALMEGRLFPIDFMETASRKSFQIAPQEDYRIGEMTISSCPLRHPQGSVAYKIKGKEKTIVISTDTEHPEEGVDERLVSFVEGADYLVYDAFFTPEEYEAGRQGWGHSTWLAGVEVAKAAGVKNLYLSHFNPNHSDQKIDDILTSARKEFSQTHAARQGLQLTI